MKKLKMIVASVAVLAIVGSAFAFKAKVGRFCILDIEASGTNCTTYTLANQKITTGAGLEWKYYPTFDGNPTTCTAANNGLCTATFKLTTD
ncbi:hypothetical protein [Niastella populi]|uniref:Uncharacterized protein n=1 Tax=Niastella populi TaxID=550983 RepID=A0A1V9GAX1_9BACT|nr:hypothetical protein [Niastella populi]OQP67821.1 hypothetical protein A4R26_32730 [Niastella populi]